ncbi:SPOR domain-containing protein [Duganella radicis]|uniref:SPOR domain-containing protein n=1 Tax=Duganella radicis TaxID=551988 RepID=A0A6L6PGR8_9BURK|nr:SPOR domain-containing protein [Duganella radicis]
MLKFIFWSLLAVNAALFAYGRGYLGHFSGNEHEPERLLNQLNADKLAIIPADKANAASVAAAPAAPDVKPEACLEIGSFVLADARRFENQLETLKLGDRQSRHNLPGSEISSYIVYIPPQGSKEGADKKAGELRALGISNYFIMSDNSPLRWGISLGVFKTEGAAQNQLAALMKQGVRTARVAPRMSGSKLLAFQFRDVDTELKARLEKIRAGFPNAELHTCK